MSLSHTLNNPPKAIFLRKIEIRNNQIPLIICFIFVLKVCTKGVPVLKGQAYGTTRKGFTEISTDFGSFL